MKLTHTLFVAIVAVSFETNGYGQVQTQVKTAEDVEIKAKDAVNQANKEASTAVQNAQNEVKSAVPQINVDAKDKATIQANDSKAQVGGDVKANVTKDGVSVQGQNGANVQAPVKAPASVPNLQLGTGQLGTGQLGTGQLGTGQLGVGQSGSGQIGIGTGQVGNTINGAIGANGGSVLSQDGNANFGLSANDSTNFGWNDSGMNFGGERRLFGRFGFRRLGLRGRLLARW